MYNVLIVDDEKMIREGIRRAIPWSTLSINEIYTAASAKEALEIVECRELDLIITDISMSEMSGLDLIEKIRKTNEDIRIIILTGYDRFDYVHQALKLKVHDFLLKPIDEEELSRSIRKQLDELVEIRKNRNAFSAQKRTAGLRQQWKLDQIMWAFVSGKTVEEGMVNDFFREQRIDRKQKLQAGIMVPDLVAEEDEDGRTFRLRSIQNICFGMLDQRELGITFTDSAGRILFVLYCEKEGNVGNEAATELAGVLQDEYEMRPRMVLGSVVDGFDRLYISYNDALHELESERRPFRDMVIKNRADRKREIIFQEVFREFKEAMISNVDDKENVMHIFERFCMAAGSYNLSAKYTERCCFELASSVAFAYLNDSGSQSEENLNALMKTLNGASRETACQLTETFFQRLLSREAGSDHELVRKVQSRIHENLGEDLSVAKIAAELYVTPNYLSRLFKRITGEGCNEYIVRKRIEKAKALLETSTMKVGEIAQLVGYVDMNYFSLAFKKHTGMSPTKYRAQAQCGK